MWRWDMHGTTCANGSALSTHRFWVSSTWICLFLHANEFEFKCSSLFLVVLESMVGSVEFWNRFDKLWLQLNHDPAGHCTKPQLSQREREGIHDKLDKDAVLDGKSVRSCGCDQTWWALVLSVDRAGVLWPPAHEKPGLLLVLIRPGPLPPMQKLSTQPLPFHSNLWTPWEIIFQRCCGFPLDYCAPSVSSCASVASVLACAAV